MSEALERLLFKRFLQDLKPDIDGITMELLRNSDTSIYDSDITETLKESYETFKSSVRDGAVGKTAKFWIMYLDMMVIQHMSHTSVQENNFSLRLYSWKSILPFYFAVNMHNYARYGSYYVEVLASIHTLYPGLFELLGDRSLSVQAQTKYPLRTSIDQRGEQTINRSAKTSGGVTQFATNESSVLKWCLNRAEAAGSVNALHEMAGLTDSAAIYKPLRPA